MAKKKKESIFIRELTKDIRIIQQLLEEHISNISAPFSRIISDLKKNHFEYDSGVLELFINEKNLPKHLSHENIKNLRILLSVKINKVLDCKEIIKNDDDPFFALEFNLYAYAYDFIKEQDVVYSLHLDRHIIKKGDNPSSEVHPMYHFQFGGKKLKEKNIDYGQALFFDTPRISYHPMDFILGLDFVLSNFFPNIWNALQREGNYMNIIRKYQEYFMKPYYQSIANSFDRSLPQNWNPQELYPQLVKI